MLNHFEQIELLNQIKLITLFITRSKHILIIFQYKPVKISCVGESINSN